MGMRLVWAGIVGGIIGFLVCAFIVYPPHSGWNESLDLPAWVQAIGSIAAIVVPVTLWRRDEKKRSSEARAKGIAMALTIRPILRRLRRMLVVIRNQWRDGDEFPYVIEINAFNEPSRKVKLVEYFVLPDEMREIYPRLHELGQGAKSALLAIARAMDIVDQISLIEYHLVASDKDQMQKFSSSLKDRVNACYGHTNSALDNIKDVIEFD